MTHHTSPSVNHTALYDAIIIGSGPGGAATANQLVKLGQKVAILEWGNSKPLQGRFLQMAKIAAIPGKGAFIHSDLSLLMRGITTGGSSAINFATAMPPPLERFDQFDIDLRPEMERLKQALPINPLPDKLTGPFASRIKESAQAIGLNWQKLDKFIYTDKCHASCHRCSYGCPYNAKWNARFLIEEAVSLGAQLITNAKVSRVLIKNGSAIGVKYKRHGSVKTIRAGKVVLAAGGIGSPRILEASGIPNATHNYFVDPVIAIMGQVDDLEGGNEIPMAAGMQLPDEGITLSDLALPKPLYQAFALQAGKPGHLFSHNKTLSVMVKIADEPGGHIGQRWLNKSLSHQDRERFSKGTDIAESILSQAGAKSIFRTHHFAAHPGGSAAIGKIVDSNLKTETDGLYVCDASVLPGPWGLAPSYTLLCLGMYLAGRLVNA